MKTIQHKFDESIVRSYDIRGIVNETLFTEDAKVIGQLFGLEVGEGRTVNVGYDGRHSSKELKENLIIGLQEVGVNVCEIGLVPTPLLYFSCVHNLSSGGIMVTGSHNPKEYNGFKFVLGNLPFYEDQLKGLEKKARNFSFKKKLGKREQVDLQAIYLEKIFQNFTQKKNINIVWDCGNGSTGDVLSSLAKRIKGKQKLLFNKIDGDFPNHHPDPSEPKNLLFCKKEIRENGYDAGIAFDGDGDRIGVLDNKGRIIPGDILLLIFSDYVIKKNNQCSIIGDVKCSQILFDEIKKKGASYFISKTGHSHVKMNMKETQSDLAGEMSGHIFFRENNGFDDALFASLKLIEILTDSKDSLSEIFDKVPKSFNTPEIRIDCDDSSKFKLIKEISIKQRELKKNIIDIDGLRVSSSGGWWLLRASNTQPCLVVRCEAESKKGLVNQINELKQAIHEFSPEIASKINVEN